MSLQNPIPSTQFAVFRTPAAAQLHPLPVPAPGPGEVLVQNVAVASNPKDWKYPEWQGGDYSYVEGNDVAGLVAAVGPGVTEYKRGARVAALTRMGTGFNPEHMATKENKYGAYAQYSLAPTSTTFPLPDSTSFEEAATLPLAVLTAAIGLFVSLALPEPPLPNAPSASAPSTGKSVIVYGASTSVGAYAVQLAKRAGLFVVGVAGSSSDYAQALGADAVVDYRAHKDAAALEGALVAALAGRPCAAAYDAVTEGPSTLTLARVLARTAPGGKRAVTYVLALSDETRRAAPPDVDFVETYVGTAFGANEAFSARFAGQIAAYLAPSPSNPTPLRPNRARVVPGGLAGVGEGLALLKAGKVHGEKLVYRVAETPGLAQ